MKIAPGRKALVTGGASGIGLEVARRLASQGAVVALVDVNAQRLKDAVSEIGKAAIATRADVSSPSEIRRAVGHAIAEFGGLDTLVVSAGVIHVKLLGEVSEEDWDHTLDINLKGAFLSCQAAAPALTASGRGRIVTISSDAGRRGVPRLHAYSASKFGLIGLTESLAGELAPMVTVNSVCPVGAPTTGMGEQMLSWKAAHTGRTPNDVLANIARGLPLGRVGTVADIADAVMFLISESANFITGVALDIDGGARLNAIPGAGA